MEITEVRFRKYIPSKGMALKVTRRMYNYRTRKLELDVSYCPTQCVIDDADLVSPVEEVSMEEYDNYINSHNDLGINALL